MLINTSERPGVYVYKTAIGKCKAEVHPLYFLSTKEKAELDIVGYTGKDVYGKKCTFEKYLNSLGKGKFTVTQTKFDNGNFSEEYFIARTTVKSEKKGVITR